MSATMPAETTEVPKRTRSLWPMVAVLVVVVAAVGVVIYLAAGSGDEPTHAYELNGTLDDAKGGPAAQSLGGTVGAEGYTFGPNEGLTIDVDLGESYTIETRLRVDGADSFARWAKILDYRDLTTDAGLYVHNQDKLQFFFMEGCGDRGDDIAQGCLTGGPRGPEREQLSTPAGGWQMGTFHTVRLVRDGDAGTVAVYLDDQLQTWSPAATGEQLGDIPLLEAFDDFMGEATQAGRPVLHVAVDDQGTNGREALGGEIDYIHITIP